MPHTEQIGPYRLLSALGQGGMGTVWRAEHSETRQLVALKTVRLIKGNLLQSLRREIQAVARLTHPNIVQIIDEGVHHGSPYYAMELVSGQTLGAWHQSLPSEGSLSAVLQMAYQLCVPLSYLHGEGFVYRDLKPDNILIRPDGTPVFVDFGLASNYAQENREILSIESKFLGTPSYMSPEQIRGESLDARSDLYALGVILYELLTGERPFVHANHFSVLKMHLQLTPPTPSKKRPDVPPGVDSLVERLLAKRRQDRFGYAQDVARALLALGIEPPEARPISRPYLYRPSCSGRGEQLTQLIQRINQLKSGDGGLVLLGGESGAGKTRLAAEAARSLEPARISVMVGSCDERIAKFPLEAFHGILRSLCDYCKEFGLEASEQIFGPRGKVLALYEPSIASLPGQDAYPEPAALPPESAKQRLYAFLAETLFASSERRSLFLIIDDLQWADNLSFGFLEFFLYGGALCKTVLILALYRLEETTPQLQRLLSNEGAMKMSLTRLDEEAVTQIVSEMLALPEVPSYFARYIANESEGNPFFIAEYLQLSIEEESLSRDHGGTWRLESAEAFSSHREDALLPRGLSALVTRRFSGLPVCAKELAEVASVLGRSAAAPLLMDVSRLTEEGFGIALRELIRRHIVEDNGTQISFVHDKLREACYQSLSEERRVILHSSAAQGIEAFDPTNFAVLGLHWESANERLLARRSYLRAAESAEELYDLEQAKLFYLSFLRLVEAPTRASIAVRIRFAEKILLVRGEGAEAQGQLELALQEARSIGALPQEISALRQLGFVLLRLSCPTECEALYQQSLALARQTNDLSAEGHGLQALANFYFEQGRFQEAGGPFLRALEIHRETKNRTSEGMCLGNIAGLYFNQGRLEEAKTFFHQAILIHRETNNLRSEAYAVGNLGVMEHSLGAFTEALRYCEQALDLARRTGDRRFEGICLANLSNNFLALHQEHKAIVAVTEALALSRRLGEKRLEAVYLVNLANLSYTMGKIEEAEIHYRQALPLARQVNDQRTEGIGAGQFAALLLLCFGKNDEVGELLQKADALLSAMGDVVERGRILCVWGHLALSLGEPSYALFSEVEKIVREFQLGEGSDLGEAYTTFSLSREAASRGEALHNGFWLEALPGAAQQWLKARRAL